VKDGLNDRSKHWKRNSDLQNCQPYRFNTKVQYLFGGKDDASPKSDIVYRPVPIYSESGVQVSDAIGR